MSSATQNTDGNGNLTLTVAGSMIGNRAALTTAFNAALEAAGDVSIDITAVTEIGIDGATLLLGVSRNRQGNLRINATQAPLIGLLRIGNSPGANFEGDWWTITVC
jgi:hypothetical protein